MFISQFTLQVYSPRTYACTESGPTTTSNAIAKPTTCNVNDSTSCFSAGSTIGVIAAVLVTAIAVITATTLIFWLVWRNRVKKHHLGPSEPRYDVIDSPIHTSTSMATPTPFLPLSTGGAGIDLQGNQCYRSFAS